MPSRKPTAAGITDCQPSPAVPISMAGMSSDHTEAATMTPEAKPSSAFCTRSGISPFMKKTNAEPSIVPNNGMSKPMMIVVVMTVFLRIN